MPGRLSRLAALAFLAAALAGCASEQAELPLPAEPGRSLALQTNPTPIQCAPYAREHSEVKIHGDAWTWWDQAEGKFPRFSVPVTGSVIVLNRYSGPEHGHVAVVRQLVSSREIRVDHANWLDDGSIYLNDPVVDVSADNDWSMVKVWNIKTGGWGQRLYPVQGFIGGAGESPRELADKSPVARAEFSKDSE